MGGVAAGFRLPAAGVVDRRCRKAGEALAGVAQRHRADQRAHPLGVASPRTCAKASAIITATANPTRVFIFERPRM